MTFEEAIRESIAQYYKGHSFEKYTKATGKKLKYTKDYFDKVEADMLSAEDVEETEDEEMEDE